MKNHIYEVKIDALDEHFGLVSDLVLNKLLNPASPKSHQENQNLQLNHHLQAMR